MYTSINKEKQVAQVYRTYRYLMENNDFHLNYLYNIYSILGMLGLMCPAKKKTIVLQK